MLKGKNNQWLLDEATVRAALEEYFNRRLFTGAKIKVTSIWEDDEADGFRINVGAAK